ncbi:MAG: HNH endonuclease [Nannocystaceae bacterium]
MPHTYKGLPRADLPRAHHGTRPRTARPDRDHAVARPPVRKYRNANRAAVRRLIRAQGAVCSYCGCDLSLRKNAPDRATLDHVVPLSRGGLDAPENWALACAKCNAAKADKLW